MEKIEAEMVLRIAALVLIIGLIGWAGLTPFDFARVNDVQWMESNPGLRFGGVALAISEADLRWDTDSTPAPMSVEMWVRTDSVADVEPRAWFVLVDESRLTPFGIRQEGTDLVVWDAVTNPGGDRWYNDRRVADAIQPGEIQHFAVTSNESVTRLYLDGLPANSSGGFGIPIARQGESFSGTLVIGAGPPWDTLWSGEILGIVLHHRVLEADEILRHAQFLPGPDISAIAKHTGTVAVYTFDEHEGTKVREWTGSENSLILPSYFHPPRQRILAPIDPQYWSEGWNLLDILVNFGGFVPFGFVLAGLLQQRLAPIGLVFSAAALAISISLTIELTQALMVSRNSSIQDMILNTLGAFVGAATAIGLQSRRLSRR